MDKAQARTTFIDTIARFTAYTSKHLPDDVRTKLKELGDQEDSEMAKIIYTAMFDDLTMADALSRPVCQDTGIIQYFVQVGTHFPFPWIEWELMPNRDDVLIYCYLAGGGSSLPGAAKVLLRPLGSHNSNPRGSELEARIEKGLNELHIGPGGFSGKNSVMGVHIEQAARHPATIAVGLSTGCWAHRRSLIRVDASMGYEIISHRGATI